MPFKRASRIIAEAKRRSCSYYRYARTYRKGVIYSATFDGDAHSEHSYIVIGRMVIYGDGFRVLLPKASQ